MTIKNLKLLRGKLFLFASVYHYTGRTISSSIESREAEQGKDESEVLIAFFGGAWRVVSTGLYKLM